MMGNLAKRYAVNESFLSLQGEGLRSGEVSIFLRFTGCNLRCSGQVIDQAFQPICDTEFISSTSLTADQIIEQLKQIGGACRWIVLTGGEPTQQLDDQLIATLKIAGYKLAIETNGTNLVPVGIDWITVSPKIAEHAIKQRTATEVKYVRGYGQGVPRTVVKADYYLISPAFDGSSLDPQTLAWCIKLCKENPTWRLSVQQHKGWFVR